MKKFTTVLTYGFLIGVAALMGSCGEPPKNEGEKAGEPKTDSAKTSLFQVGDELFSIPSPVQTAMLIKTTGAKYNKEVLNDAKRASGYSTRVQRALNLGIYGADLGYAAMYEQTQEAIGLMNASRKLADELGVSGAFNETLLKRFQSNLGNRDSLLVLVADAFRASDSYLKNNESDDIGSLILAGGWIESLHFANNVAKETSHPEVVRRIGEQKNTLENLIKLLQRYSNNEEYSDIVEHLVELYSSYENVQFSYHFEKPSTMADKKLTVIKSTSEVKITNDQINAINEKVKTLRNQIIG